MDVSDGKRSSCSSGQIVLISADLFVHLHTFVCMNTKKSELVVHVKSANIYLDSYGKCETLHENYLKYHFKLKEQKNVFKFNCIYRL